MQLIAAAETPHKTPDVGTAFDYIKDILKNPVQFCRSGDLTRRRLFMRLAFRGTLTYDRKAGFWNRENVAPLPAFQALCIP